MRCIMFADDKGIRLQSRRLNNVSYRYPELKKLRDNIGAKNAILDGEIVVLSSGKPDFYKLQKRFRLCKPDKIELYAERTPVTYVVFDILYLNGQSCLELPLYRRKELIAGIVQKSRSMMISDPFPGQGIKLFREACKLELEGIVAKKADSPYLIGQRSKDWFKIKAKHQAICNITGITWKDTCWGKAIESLILAEPKGSQMFICGHVRSGLSNAELATISKSLSDHKCDLPSISGLKKGRGIQWVNPDLKCIIVYNERTPDGKLRAPVFCRLVE